jgi:hypothetical protein
MLNLAWLLTGGFAKGYRTQILGVTTALSTIALWAVGDMTLSDLIAKAPVIFGGLGLAALAPRLTTRATKRRDRQRQDKMSIFGLFMRGSCVGN